jgi:hypothetical protein
MMQRIMDILWRYLQNQAIVIKRLSSLFGYPLSPFQEKAMSTRSTVHRFHPFFFRLIQVWQAWNSQQTGETPAHLFGVSMIQYPILLVKNTYKLGSLLFGLLGGPATA